MLSADRETSLKLKLLVWSLHNKTLPKHSHIKNSPIALLSQEGLGKALLLFHMALGQSLSGQDSVNICVKARTSPHGMTLSTNHWLLTYSGWFPEGRKQE